MHKGWEVELATLLIAGGNLMRIRMENWCYNAPQNPGSLPINGEEQSINRDTW